MDLTDYRNEIDAIDDEICRLFENRMRVVEKVSAYKAEHGIPIDCSGRESQILTRVSRNLSPEINDLGLSLYRSIFDISKAYEAMTQENTSELYQSLKALISEKPIAFPRRATVACQGCEGAYSQVAAEKFFDAPDICFTPSFEGVIKMVSEGKCEYGVLPIENSTAGSVNAIYDLLARYDVNIVRSTRVLVEHNLLAARGAKMEDIKTIYSHPQAISQCSNFLHGLPDVKVIPYENTAMAAAMVAKDESCTSASISSATCARLYNMETLASSVQNYGNNRTRFVCICPKRVIFPGSNRTSIMMVMDHKPRQLYSVMSRFNATGANLVKLESRPIPNSDFEFMFYFDIELSMYDDKFLSLISELDNCGAKFKYLGTYLEIV